MNKYKIARVITINFATSLIISYVACFLLAKMGLNDVLFIGNLFGLYFLTVYGIDMLVQSGEIPNNKYRFILAIIFIIVFDIVFLYVMPLLFGADAFSTVDYLILVFDGVKFDLIFDVKFYMAIFGLIMLYFNYYIYKKTKKAQG